MAFESYALNQMMTEIVDGTLTFRLHDGDPGANGTANLIPDTQLDRPDVTGAASWSFTNITNGRRLSLTADLDFGNASQMIAGVSWLSYFESANFVARRELSAPVDIANGAAVSITAATVRLEITSTD